MYDDFVSKVLKKNVYLGEMELDKTVEKWDNSPRR